MRSVERAMDLSIQRRYLWSDSTITLHWIKESPHKWKTYVANRVSAIQDLTDVREWRHIRSVDNPADVISRGSFPRALVTMEDWWHGPSWLVRGEAEWPTEDTTVFQVSEVDEVRVLSNIVTATEYNSLLNLIENHSSLTKIQSIVAQVLRFISNSQSDKSCRKLGTLTVHEINEALLKLIRVVQNQQFASDFESLNKNGRVHIRSNL